MHNSSQVYQFIVIKIWFFFKWDKRWQHNSRTKKGIEFWKKNAKKSMFWHLCVPNSSLGWQLVWLQSTFEVKLSILSTIYALCSFYTPIFSLNSLKSLKILIFFLKEPDLYIFEFSPPLVGGEKIKGSGDGEGNQKGEKEKKRKFGENKLLTVLNHIN